jgi:hypothetical protein
MPSQCAVLTEWSSATGDLPGMLATLASYDRMFGPAHIQTLSLMTLVGRTLAERGDRASARRLLERVVQGVARVSGPTHATRLTALAALRDLHLEGEDLSAAIATQTELAGCWHQLSGSDAPETRAARTRLESLLMLLETPAKV